MRLPQKDKLQEYVYCYVVAAIVFSLVYGILNYWTAQRTDRFHLYLRWEAKIPFVPEFIYGYLSIMPLFLLPVFSLQIRQLRALCVAFVSATIVAGAIYSVLPAELAHARPTVPPEPRLLFGVLYVVALPHNLFPSLHITYSALILFAIVGNERSRHVNIAAGIWMLIIAMSVLLIRQHQIIDVIGGCLLGWLAYHYVYRRVSPHYS